MNWYNHIKIAQKPIRYRALIPVDIWIASTGDSIGDQEKAYSSLKDILKNGSTMIDHEGFNDLLVISDVQKYSDVINNISL